MFSDFKNLRKVKVMSSIAFARPLLLHFLGFMQGVNLLFGSYERHCILIHFFSTHHDQWVSFVRGDLILFDGLVIPGFIQSNLTLDLFELFQVPALKVVDKLLLHIVNVAL